MIRWVNLVACLFPVICLASPWSFDQPITITDQSLSPHFHHLDGAGRRHLAANDKAVALIWEDDRSGNPQVYVAIKTLRDQQFRLEFQLSSGEEAYEPSIVGLDAQRWLAAWEQDEEIWACIVDSNGVTTPVNVSGGPGRQVTLAVDSSGNAVAVWARVKGRTQMLVATPMVHTPQSLTVGEAVSVTPQTDNQYQGYPAAVFTDEHLVVGWEDRRAGHTRLFTAWRVGERSFSAARQLNEHRAPDPAQATSGGGSGVMRVSLIQRLDNVQAVWLDKRNPGSGYAVWGARSLDNGRDFGINHQVQDDLGAAAAQWHASVAAMPAGFVSVWDDAREAWSNDSETGDVFISWQGKNVWSEDYMVPGASGEGYQGSPVVAVDTSGDLHLVWIHRENLTAPTELRYIIGHRTDGALE